MSKIKISDVNLCNEGHLFDPENKTKTYICINYFNNKFLIYII